MVKLYFHTRAAPTGTGICPQKVLWTFAGASDSRLRSMFETIS
jgi:hypothetical protein